VGVPGLHTSARPLPPGVKRVLRPIARPIATRVRPRDPRPTLLFVVRDDDPALAQALLQVLKEHGFSINQLVQSVFAIIQGGSNANGTFIRYADGTQICTRRIVIDDSSVASGDQTFAWTYPAAFVANAIVSADIGTLGTGTNSIHNRMVKKTVRRASGQPNSTGIEVYIRWDGVVTSNGDLQLIAIGRWF
jgi:hypothetical protein